MKSYLGRVALVAGLLLPVLALSLRGAEVSQLKLNYGYSLLHDLCEQDKTLDLLLIVKTTPPAVADFARDVTKHCEESLAILDRMAARDSAIHFNDTGLPLIEQRTRDSINNSKRQMLLFGTKSGRFAKTLLITQIEASAYGMNLANVLADAEPNSRRAADLRRIAHRWEKLRDRAYTLIFQGGA